MCLATPLKIIKIENGKAIVESDGKTNLIDLSLISDPKVGDYILSHGDMAINKIPKEEAEKILKMIETNADHNHCNCCDHSS
jgi:hydrogenase expression/formation protein HypC